MQTKILWSAGKYTAQSVIPTSRHVPKHSNKYWARLMPFQRRTRKSVPPASTSASKPAAKSAAKPAAKPSTATQPKPNEAAAPARRGSASEDNTSGRSTPRSSAGTSTLKRSDSKSGAKKSQTAGDLFKSFAKAKPKAKEADRSQESTPAPPEDGRCSPPASFPQLIHLEPMQGMSEDEGDVEDEPEIKVDDEKNEVARKAREARQEKLRKMMEDDGKPQSTQVRPVPNNAQMKPCPTRLQKPIPNLNRPPPPAQIRQN